MARDGLVQLGDLARVRTIMQTTTHSLEDFKKIRHGFTKSEVTALVGRQDDGVRPHVKSGSFSAWRYDGVEGRSLYIVFAQINEEGYFDGVEQIFFGVGPQDDTDVPIQHLLEPLVVTKQVLESNDTLVRKANQLQRGMSQDVVREKMGRPQMIVTNEHCTHWQYGCIFIGFNETKTTGGAVDWVINVGEDGLGRKYFVLPQKGVMKGSLPTGLALRGGTEPQHLPQQQQQQQQHRMITVPNSTSTPKTLPAFITRYRSDVEPTKDMLKLKFTPQVKRVAQMAPIATIDEIAGENTIVGASIEFAKKYGGGLVQDLIKTLPDAFYEHAEKLKKHIIVDVRVHRLNVGDVPAYPGWHCDGWPRNGYHEQPNPLEVTPATHIVCTLSSEEGGVSRTEFINAPVEINVYAEPPASFKLWQAVDTTINMASPAIGTYELGDGQVCAFDQLTLHRATPAKKRGWRLYFRASHSHTPPLDGGGKLGRQEMIYNTNPNHGW